MVIILVALATGLYILEASQQSMQTQQHNNKPGRIIILNVPAVAKEGGKLIKLIIKLTDSSGVVFSEGVNVGEDTYSSAWTSFLIASLLSGRSPFEKGIEITIVTESTSVEGPSASLAIALASYILLSDYEIPSFLSNVSITGALPIQTMS